MRWYQKAGFPNTNGRNKMQWHQKAGLGFFVGAGALLFLQAPFRACPSMEVIQGLGVWLAGITTYLANTRSWLFRRWVFRGVIRVRRYAYAAAGLAVLAVEALSMAPRLHRYALAAGLLLGFLFLLPDVAAAGTGPWEVAVKALCKSFSGVIGRGLALIAVILGGLMFAFGEGGSKSAIAGLVFGAGMVLSAPTFLGWIGLGGDLCPT